jgi:hypothetical protein
MRSSPPNSSSPTCLHSALRNVQIVDFACGEKGVQRRLEQVVLAVALAALDEIMPPPMRAVGAWLKSHRQHQQMVIYLRHETKPAPPFRKLERFPMPRVPVIIPILRDVRRARAIVMLPFVAPCPASRAIPSQLVQRSNTPRILFRRAAAALVWALTSACLGTVRVAGRKPVCPWLGREVWLVLTADAMAAVGSVGRAKK